MRQRAREAAAIALLEATEDVAAQRGLEGTSIAAIAERAGVAVGTLYNYFPDRDAMLAALFKLRRAELLPRIEAAAVATRELPFEQRLASYLTAVLAAFDDYRRFCRVAMSAADQGMLKPRGRSAVLAAIVGELAEILRPEHGDAADDLAHMMFGALKALMHARLERDEPLAPAGRLLASTFLQGISPR